MLVGSYGLNVRLRCLKSVSPWNQITGSVTLDFLDMRRRIGHLNVGGRVSKMEVIGACSSTPSIHIADADVSVHLNTKNPVNTWPFWMGMYLVRVDVTEIVCQLRLQGQGSLRRQPPGFILIFMPNSSKMSLRLFAHPKRVRTWLGAAC